MNIIISGGSGYIGTALLNGLISEGSNHGVIIRSDDQFIASLKPQVDIYKADISKPIDFNLNKPYDIFIHLAAANDIDSLNAQTALLSTTLGTKHCLDFCQKNNITKFIYFSTFQVYGKVEGKMNEKNVLEPKNDYAITHMFAEEYVKMYHIKSDINYIILRPTNIYGAPVNKVIDRWTLVPNCFCKEAFEKQKITLLSSGKQLRDFLNLVDLVNVTKLFCNNFEKFNNKAINVSSGNNFTIIEIAKLVRKQYESYFQKKCDLIVKSDLPKEINNYIISRKLINRLNYNFSHKNSILNEINTIFNILKFNKTHTKI